MTDSSQPYRVLARKYRPRNFDELIGQDAMVQTLGNAIRRGRLAHAFLMTGVRGVGKTSTARLIAKALNCVGTDGQGGPTIDPCGICEPCVAIAEGRHIDVIEMDAASHTGIDDVREIIEAVRYAAVSARYKVYIIDEVHMLSKQAFNGLLKTLEEPPAHVKFLFATTEANKVPVTVLSRCQRFDLRRIPAEKLIKHFAHVVEAEGIRAEPDALTLIAHAAEGSARDGLSILDQAIAHADTVDDALLVTADQVRDMLGLSDRGATRRLLGLLLVGETPLMLQALAEQHELGVEPLALMRGLMEIVHAITVAKAGRGVDDPGQSAEEKEALSQWAGQIGFAPLHRIWQLLLKGHEEVANATLPREASEMALLRIIHAASLPDPSELTRLLREGNGGGHAARSAEIPAAGATSGAPEAMVLEPSFPPTFAAMVDALWKTAAGLADRIEHQVRLVRYAPPELVVQPTVPVDDNFARTLRDALKVATDLNWTVTIGAGDAEPTLAERKIESELRARQAILDTPIVKAAMMAFPDADLVPQGEDEQWSASA
ncbi:DNA polymerase III subunit gamma/tau [soil metagenome]